MDTRVIICGAREFTDYAYLENTCLKILYDIQAEWFIPAQDIEVVSGDAKGTDSLGNFFSEKWLKRKSKSFPVKSSDWEDMTPPCWPKVNSRGKQYNSLAGYKRNTRMVEYADENKMGVVIAFIKGDSRGTKHTIKEAKKAGLRVYVVYTEKDKISKFN